MNSNCLQRLGRVCRLLWVDISCIGIIREVHCDDERQVWWFEYYQYHSLKDTLPQIQKAGFDAFQNPQNILDFPKKMRTQKPSSLHCESTVVNLCKLCSVIPWILDKGSLQIEFLEKFGISAQRGGGGVCRSQIFIQFFQNKLDYGKWPEM